MDVFICERCSCHEMCSTGPNLINTNIQTLFSKKSALYFYKQGKYLEFKSVFVINNLTPPDSCSRDRITYRSSLLLQRQQTLDSLLQLPLLK